MSSFSLNATVRNQFVTGMKAIEIKGISKSYGKVKALDSISLDVASGEIFGLIGPDGAGKTTLFRIMTTLVLPDEGSGTVCGLDIVKDYSAIRRIIGYMPGRFSLYQDLSVKENLDYFATLFGTTLEANYGTIKEIYSQIEPFADRCAGKLSGGMKQKLALCCALVHRPSVLFLDEPTTGVDAVSRTDFWNMLSRIKASGVTIFVSTPYMDEAARCDRLALIRDGGIIGTGTPDEIVSEFPFGLLAVRGERMYPLLKELRRMKGVVSCFSFGDSHHLAYDPAVTDREEILAGLSDIGFGDCSVRDISPCIEDCFMWLSSRSAADRTAEA